MQAIFRSSYMNNKEPLIVLKDVDFENLKALVEYMYKGEANVPQHMLSSFIRYYLVTSGTIWYYLVTYCEFWPFH